MLSATGMPPPPPPPPDLLFGKVVKSCLRDGACLLSTLFICNPRTATSEVSHSLALRVAGACVISRVEFRNRTLHGSEWLSDPRLLARVRSTAYIADADRVAPNSVSGLCLGLHRPPQASKLALASDILQSTQGFAYESVVDYGPSAESSIDTVFWMAFLPNRLPLTSSWTMWPKFNEFTYN
jgi:hypothetical protein